MHFEGEILDFSLARRDTLTRVIFVAAMAKSIVPSFFLYGEPPRSVGDRFLHIEALGDRSRPNDWNIRPHAHTALNHIFHLTSGGGAVRAETLDVRFATPCVILIPARVIHGFEFEDDTSGTVLTVSEAFLREQLVRDPELEGLFAAPVVFECRATQRDAAAIGRSLEQLSWELAWRAPGHAAAVESQFQSVLVALLRLDHRCREEASRARTRQAEMVARFRQLLEADFRSNKALACYARALNISASRLRAVCIEITHRSPLQLIQDRLLLEAKRMLLYTNMSISEAGYNLGFEDPAYFTRFFTKNTGISPRGFRAKPR